VVVGDPGEKTLSVFFYVNF